MCLVCVSHVYICSHFPAMASVSEFCGNGFHLLFNIAKLLGDGNDTTVWFLINEIVINSSPFSSKNRPFSVPGYQLNSSSLTLICSQKSIAKSLWGPFQRLQVHLKKFLWGSWSPGLSLPHIVSSMTVSSDWPWQGPAAISVKWKAHFRLPKEGQGSSTDVWTPSSLDSGLAATYSVGYTEGLTGRSI